MTHWWWRHQNKHWAKYRRRLPYGAVLVSISLYSVAFKYKGETRFVTMVGLQQGRLGAAMRKMKK